MDKCGRGAKARLGCVRITDIGHARVGILGRALDSRAGLAALPAAHLDAALADGAEILVEAFLIVMAAEGAVELAAIARDEVPIIAFFAGIDDAIAAFRRLAMRAFAMGAAARILFALRARIQLCFYVG